jgi:hypothetical protein
MTCSPPFHNLPNRAPHACPDIHPCINIANFTHSVKTRAARVKFLHQLLCNPKISTLLKAVQKGFLNGCPNLSEKLILKYLNPSPATANGHMKWPRHRIRSTRLKIMPTQEGIGVATSPVQPPLQIPIAPPPIWISLGEPNLAERNTRPASTPNIIVDYCKESITNVFCYGAFASHHSGVVYSNLTG